MARLSPLRNQDVEGAHGAAFWKRYDELKSSQDTTDDWIATGAGFAANHIRAWKARNFIPRADYVNHIAKRLGETSEYLLDGKKPSYLSEKEAEFLARAKKYVQVIEGYDRMNELEQKAVLAAIKVFVEDRADSAFPPGIQQKIEDGHKIPGVKLGGKIVGKQNEIQDNPGLSRDA